MQAALFLKAYPRTTEAGGGFRGVVVDKRTPDNARHESDVVNTYEEARDWAMGRGHALMGEAPYRRCSIKMPSRARGLHYRAWVYAF